MNQPIQIGIVRGQTVSVEWDDRWCMWYVSVRSQDLNWRRSSTGYFGHVNPAFRGEAVLFREKWKAIRSGRRTLKWLESHSITGPEWVQDRFFRKECSHRIFDANAWKIGQTCY